MKHELRIMVFIILSIILTSLFIIHPVLALENDIGYSRISPASLFYFLKGVREAFEMEFAGTDRVKMLRRVEFATRRLREVNTLVRDQKEELIPATLERYTVLLNQLGDKHLQGSEIGIKLRSDLSVHLNALEKIYNQSSAPRSKIFIRSALNRIIQRVDIEDDSKLTVCRLFSKEASSSALNQTEQTVLLDRAEKCFKSLEARRV